MLRKEDFEHIGTLGRAHGTQGEVSAKLSVDLSGLWEGADTSLFLMLEEQGLLIPYRVLKRRTKGEDIDLITFSGITTKDEADALTGHPVWLDRDYLSGEEDVEDFFDLQHFVGFDLYDASESRRLLARSLSSLSPRSSLSALTSRGTASTYISPQDYLSYNISPASITLHPLQPIILCVRK